MTAVILLAIGLGIGCVSGLVGIGGGVLVIPILMFFFGFSQTRANGTSIAMLLPPIGIFAVIAYHRAGNIDWQYALLLALGYAVGAYIGARLLNDGRIHPTALRVGFALLLIYCAGRLLFRGDGHAGAALQTSLLVLSSAGFYTVMRLLGHRWGRVPDWGTVYRNKLNQQSENDFEI